MTSIKTDNIMGTMPMGRLILKMSLPMMFSMLMQSLYNIVDSMFVAQLSEKALTAVTLAMPLQSIMSSVTVGLSVGVNAVLSKHLGEGNQTGVNRSAGNGLLLEWACFALFLIIGQFAARPFFSMQTQDLEIVAYGSAYASIVCTLSFGLVNQVIMERLLISTGKTLGSMASLFTGAVVNTILDPIMIFGWFGLPAMGIRGAAYATVIAQTVAASVGTLLNLTHNPEIRFSLAAFRPHGKTMKEMLLIGFPAMLSNAANAVVAFGMNRILLSFTSTATAIYGVFVRLQGFAMMPVYGLRNTIVSVLAYNYGAGHRQRIERAIRICCVTTISLTLTVTVAFLAFPGLLLALFNAQDSMMTIGTEAMRIMALGMPLSGLTVILGAIFQSFGESRKEFAVSMTRMAVLLGGAWLLSLTGQLTAVWWAFVLTEVVALALAFLFWQRLCTGVLHPMQEAD